MLKMPLSTYILRPYRVWLVCDSNRNVILGLSISTPMKHENALMCLNFAQSSSAHVWHFHVKSHSWIDWIIDFDMVEYITKVVSCVYVQQIFFFRWNCKECIFSLLTCLLKTATSSLNESDEQTSPPATPGSLGVHVANSHFSNINANRGKSGCL